MKSTAVANTSAATSPSEANVNTPSDSAAPGQLEQDLKQWWEYVDAAPTVGIASHRMSLIQ
jgi:hypothetical protein